jgi:hypothetical protein
MHFWYLLRSMQALVVRWIVPLTLIRHCFGLRVFCALDWKHFDHGLFSFPDHLDFVFENEHTSHVTGRQGMFTPPRHMSLPLVCHMVCVCPISQNCISYGLYDLRDWLLFAMLPFQWQFGVIGGNIHKSHSKSTKCKISRGPRSADMWILDRTIKGAQRLENTSTTFIPFLII